MMNNGLKQTASSFFDLGFRVDEDLSREQVDEAPFDATGFPDSFRDAGSGTDDDDVAPASMPDLSPRIPPSGASPASPAQASTPTATSTVWWIIIGVALVVSIGLAYWFVGDSVMKEADLPPLDPILFPPPDAVEAVKPSVALQILVVLLGGAALLAIIATLLHFLRHRTNPLYWEVACWTLVVIGIIVRQMVASGSSMISMSELLVSAVVGLAILPGLMRWLNKITKQPGLQHVAVPFSLGFFVDLAQVLTSHYIVRLPWLPV